MRLHAVGLAVARSTTKTEPSNEPLFKEAGISHTAQLHETTKRKAPRRRPHDLPGLIA